MMEASAFILPITSFVLASKLYGVNATIVIFIFVFYFTFYSFLVCFSKIFNQIDTGMDGRESCGVRREVKQFQYTSWPDHGTPLDYTSFTLFINRIKSHTNSSNHHPPPNKSILCGNNGNHFNQPPPIVVHCRFNDVIKFFFFRFY